jgi:hypothetical protein
MRVLAAGVLASITTLISQAALADEGGVSFWIPGFFGSLAATPQQPGWSLIDMFYNTNVRGGGDVALSREFEIGKVPLNFSGSASASVKADVPLDFVIPQYVFATPVLGGQLSALLIGGYGRNDTTLAGTLSGTITPPGKAFTRSPQQPTVEREPAAGRPLAPQKTRELYAVGPDR